MAKPACCWPGVIETVVAPARPTRRALTVCGLRAAALLGRGAAALTEPLLPRAVLTPNSRGRALTGMSIETAADLRRVGEALLALGRRRR